MFAKERKNNNSDNKTIFYYSTLGQRHQKLLRNYPVKMVEAPDMKIYSMFRTESP